MIEWLNKLRKKVFNTITSSIREQLKNDIGYFLSDLRDACSSLISLVYGEFANRDSKTYLHNWLGENISFSKPSNWGKFCLILHITINIGEVVEKIQSSNFVNEITVNIREVLLKGPSMLDDKFCNSSHLCDA